MKKKILLLLLPLLCNAVFGQQKVEAEKLVKEGVAYHDKGNYEAAITKYDKALQLDKDNLLALAEKAMSLLSLQKYDEAVVCCEKAIEKHSGSEVLKIVYVTYGNASDGLEKTDKSLEIYDEGIKQFPDFYLLYFNKGITLSNITKYDEAILCFQKSVSLNPKHASSHNAIARLLDMKEKRIPSLLAYSRFLILEPESKRSKGNLENLQKIMEGNVEKTGEKSITISISPNMLGDTTSKENSFASTDLLLAMAAALDYNKKNKKKTKVEQFIGKFETVCSSLKETQKDNYGFYWDYYVPYFVKMKDEKLLTTFAYIAFASSDDPEVSKWLKSHKTEINKFYEWSTNFNWEVD